MRLTTKGRYGVRAVVNLAAAAGNEPISISQIARKEELSPEFLEQIFFRLKKAGLIRSIRGPKGGFVLNYKPSEISVKTILDAVGEPLFPSPCAEHGSRPCPRLGECPISPVWQNFYELILKHLSGISLKDILDDAKTAAGSRPAR
jgi:Rrf2 family iron-sulfur cluster assembly transcriptional regulator